MYARQRSVLLPARRAAAARSQWRRRSPSPSPSRGGEGTAATGWRELRAPVWMDGVRAALAERLRGGRRRGPLRWDRSARSSCPAGLPLRHSHWGAGAAALSTCGREPPRRRRRSCCEEKDSAKTVGSVGGSRRSAFGEYRSVFTTVRKAHVVGGSAVTGGPPGGGGPRAPLQPART